MNIAEKNFVICGACGMKNPSGTYYCEQCGDILVEMKSMGVRRPSQMQDSSASRRPVARKAAERSVWFFFFPFVGVFIPLFLEGPKSLIVSVPAGLLWLFFKRAF